MNKLLISVALATYNGEQFIRQQMDSILAQTLSDFEVVICDDCSADSTIQILTEYASADSRIKIFKNEHNLGFKKNFEKIISFCKGEFIALCDQDDIWEPDHLQALVQEIGSNDCVCGNALLIDSKGDSLNCTMREVIPIRILPQNTEDLFSHEVYGNIVQGAASMIRQSLVKEILPIPDSVIYHDWWIALNACKNNGCKYVDHIIMKYRRHETSVTNKKNFGIATAFSIFFEDTHEKREYYKKIVTMLEELKRKESFSSSLCKIDSAIRFYKALAYRKDFLWRTKHYISNYRTIQLSPKKKFSSFLYNLLCLLTKGIIIK